MLQVSPPVPSHTHHDRQAADICGTPQCQKALGWRPEPRPPCLLSHSTPVASTGEKRPYGTWRCTDCMWRGQLVAKRSALLQSTHALLASRPRQVNHQFNDCDQPVPDPAPRDAGEKVSPLMSQFHLSTPRSRHLFRQTHAVSAWHATPICLHHPPISRKTFQGSKIRVGTLKLSAHRFGVAGS